MSSSNSAQEVLAGLGSQLPSKGSATIVVAFLLGLFLLPTILGPRIDAREPPLLNPRIPLVGHIIGFFRHRAEYHLMCRKVHKTPIATLPMLTGKVYAIWDPSLIAAGLKNKHLSTTPQNQNIIGPMANLSQETREFLKSDRGKDLVESMTGAIPGTLRGDHLQRLNETAVSHISTSLGNFAAGSDAEIPNVWMWVRRLMVEATAKAVYASEDPFAKNPGIEQSLWDWEANLLHLAIDVAPSIISPVGTRARANLTNALYPWYAARHDAHPDVSEFARSRGARLRSYGVPDDDIAKIEMFMPFAALTNTVPTLFWFFSYIVTRPGLFAQLRDEVERGLVTKRDGDEITLLGSATAVEAQCPLLWACYRETLRLVVHQVSTRTVLEDTTIADANGRQYLLKKGVAVQMALGVPHALGEYWGDDVAEFNPARFLDADKKGDGPGGVKAIRAAYQPFGGGTHLCPGRYFAITEMFAVMSAVLLFFEVEPLGSKTWKMPARGRSSLVDATTKPAAGGEGFGVKMRRREGWEGVRWRYEL